MKLGTWLDDVAMDASLAQLEVTAVAEHHDDVIAGTAFLAAASDTQMVYEHAARAKAAGAGVVVTSAPVDEQMLGLPTLRLDDVAARRGELAARFYGHATSSQTLVAVTGTNGKTSVAHHVADFDRVLHGSGGYIGTLGWGATDRLQALSMTTPNAVMLQRVCASMLSNDIRHVACEISSHALAQERAHDLNIDYAVFTNLSHDHLDYHSSMQDYGAAKARLFTDFDLRGAVINIDDPFGAGLATRIDCEVVTIGGQGDWRSECTRDAQGMSVIWQSPYGQLDARLPVFADYAVANITCAMAVKAMQGIPRDDLLAALHDLRQVPGRMEMVPHDHDFTVVVDYAHTPDALAKALTALRPGVRGRLICLVGCGGDRDPAKRPEMGAIAAAHADLVWLTADNPRSENPAEIIAAMRAGIEGGLVWECEDRAQAIGRAIFAAAVGDVVLIAGKGHENTQEIGGQFVAMDDRQIAAGALLEYRADGVVGGG